MNEANVIRFIIRPWPSGKKESQTRRAISLLLEPVEHADYDDEDQLGPVGSPKKRGAECKERYGGVVD
ncbi:hypothetical protein N7462_004302 [Penicillium macrosclerotiorum]|uniref:uncharacterized protein n=1 Tax=Penicillium macrosclerotiorum TaxID=303699 RepID=UPI00254945F6|nr:uncharacterized protein N7462_004302 [Penicillium macrosclerotiorum]KAJ5689910.1 hypothetical protein N7462_004302 [Penicillium macrosclerotiorum]